MYKPSQVALNLHAADVAEAAERGKLLEAARAADAALTAAMRAAYAAQRAEIGPRGYEDRIFNRKAKAKPAVHVLTAEAERLLTLRESHRLNRIPEVPASRRSDRAGAGQLSTYLRGPRRLSTAARVAASDFETFSG